MNAGVTIFSIGFTQRTAEEFFNALRSAGVRRLLDVRLNNTSQLAGFAKREDLRFFLREVCAASTNMNPCSRLHRRCWMLTRSATEIGVSMSASF
jgi:uncharacterized protein (DUF488 family)